MGHVTFNHTPRNPGVWNDQIDITKPSAGGILQKIASLHFDQTHSGPTTLTFPPGTYNIDVQGQAPAGPPGQATLHLDVTGDIAVFISRDYGPGIFPPDSFQIVVIV